MRKDTDETRLVPITIPPKPEEEIELLQELTKNATKIQSHYISEKTKAKRIVNACTDALKNWQIIIEQAEDRLETLQGDDEDEED